MIYLIEELVLDPYENECSAAAYYKPIGYKLNKKEADEYIINGGKYKKDDCWALWREENKYKLMELKEL
jgi:hypothetical protein